MVCVYNEGVCCTTDFLQYALGKVSLHPMLVHPSGIPLISKYSQQIPWHKLLKVVALRRAMLLVRTCTVLHNAFS